MLSASAMAKGTKHGCVTTSVEALFGGIMLTRMTPDTDPDKPNK